MNWSRLPPTNTNVDPAMWRRAQEQHSLYKELHAKLTSIGVSAADADAYLDAFVSLSLAIEALDPQEVDFAVGDHSGHFSRAMSALREMATKLGYRCV